MQEHFERLERMHIKSPINNLLNSKIKIKQGETKLNFKTNKDMNNALNKIHNAYKFMALEVAAFFAANSLIEDVLVSTKSFEILFSKPTTSNELIAFAKFSEKSMGNYIISIDLYDTKKNLVAKAKGVFRRSKNILKDIKNYQ